MRCSSVALKGVALSGLGLLVAFVVFVLVTAKVLSAMVLLRKRCKLQRANLLERAECLRECFATGEVNPTVGKMFFRRPGCGQLSQHCRWRSIAEILLSEDPARCTAPDRAWLRGADLQIRDSQEPEPTRFDAAWCMPVTIAFQVPPRMRKSACARLSRRYLFNNHIDWRDRKPPSSARLDFAWNSNYKPCA
jgi:hypothetical protein